MISEHDFLKNYLGTQNPVFIVNHSGGKDSQAMFLYLQTLIPKERLIVIHAHLPEVEWDGTIDHIKNTIGDSEFHIVQAGKTFFQMVEHRKMFPSPKNRQCTSDLKRGPIKKKIIEICNARGYNVVINCMGLRAEEGSSRAKRYPHGAYVNSNCNSKRKWLDFLPIHSWSKDKVFEYIRENGQEPHWAYAAGMTRLSCMFCIMASKQDLITAARLNPEVASRYMETERRLDHTFLMPGKGGRKFLDEILTVQKP